MLRHSSQCLCHERIISPYDDIIVIDTGAQRLVVQDTPVAHNDASLTAETVRQEGQRLVVLRNDG